MNWNQYSLIWGWEEYNKVLIARSDTHNYGQKASFECYHRRIKQLEENSWLLIVE